MRLLTGGLDGRDWSDVVPLARAVAVLAPAVLVGGRALRVLEMGDDTACTLGVRVERLRLAQLGAAVLLAACAAAAAGPVAFVALAAPQLARRLTRAPGRNPVPSLCVGAALLIVADVAGQRKSTLPRALARVLRPCAGVVLLDGHDIASRPARVVARTLGLLPRSPLAPDGIAVADLVARGRYPHQGLLRQRSDDDERAVAAAMADTGVADLAGVAVDELSGGQRRRVWIAMALAQQTPLLLPDEPTTYLDIAHQLDVLNLCTRLHAEPGRTLVAVLHDLNHAARYATHLPCRVIPDPETGSPLVIPRRRYTDAG
ncbi:MAG: iron chelate uptake ABC transporter family permease subunit [Mycobacteriales bacterium]